MTESAARTLALSDLVACRLPLAETVERLRAFPWDSDQLLVRVTVQDVAAVLRRLLVGELTAHDVQTWADALELRDDVEHVGDVAEVLFGLASPDINDPITPSLAAALVRRYDPPSN